jgi:predicted HicB family RNase H-like nuclease
MMKYKGYLGKVEFDPDARTLHGEVVGIRDVVTFQGESVQEVERAFKESVDDYLAFCAERGEEPNKPYSGRFVARVGSQIHRKLSEAAEASGQSLNAYLIERLGQEPEKKPSRKTA